MADQWNSNIPAMGNQISADVPDIKENLEHAKDAFERIFYSFSTAAGGNASASFASATGFSDGTYTYDFPTNGVAGNAVIMCGNSSTIAWFYLNTAPPGWKALSTGADSVLAIAGGSGDYNVNGGNADTANTWNIDGITAATALTTTGGPSGTTDKGVASEGENIPSLTHTHSLTAHTHTLSSDSSYRPKASVGKLFQLDTA